MKPERFYKRSGFLSHTVAYQGFLGEVFGSKPQIAPYIPTDYTQEQLDAIIQNIGAMPDISKLGNLYEQYMLNQFSAAGFPLEDLVKGGVGLTQQEMGQASQLLAGQIPADVQSQVARSGAFQSLLAGTSGGPMAGALTARDLGRTSLDLINQGAALTGQAGNAAQQWQKIAGAATMDPASMFVTPQQRAALDMQNRLYQQATQQARYNVAAEPNPALQALNQWIEQVGGTVVGSYLGGGMGGLGGGGGGGAGGGKYMTSYNPAQYDPKSDVTNPGYYTSNPAASPAADTGLSGIYSGGPGLSMGPPASSYGTDLWSQSPYLTGTNTPFDFGMGASTFPTDTSSLFALNPYNQSPFNF